MTHKERISLSAACLKTGGYPRLLLNLARQHGLEVDLIGRARYLRRADLERLGRYVRDWLHRPRMSTRFQAVTRVPKGAASREQVKRLAYAVCGENR